MSRQKAEYHLPVITAVAIAALTSNLASFQIRVKEISSLAAMLFAAEFYIPEGSSGDWYAPLRCWGSCES
jgi:hypothetical protein